MPAFSDSFWTPDYTAGLGVLFSKLQQGTVENRQLLTIARMRAEAEDVYGQRLSDIAPAVDKVQGGFSRDDGATVRKAYEGVRAEMDDASKTHKKIAQNIRDLVVNPFTRWCDAHESRIQDSQEELQARVKAHEKQAEVVKKLRSVYFGKCRLVEDLEEENKLAFQDPETSPKAKQTIPEIKVEPHPEPEEEQEEPFEIGDEIYTPEQVKKILEHMLNNIKMGETKVPILGTYLNTSSGSDIVEYLQKHMGSTSVSYAERIGQDLVDHGFLRLVGAVGSTFANSSKMFYQWRPKVFKLAGVPEPKSSLGRTFSLPTSGGGDGGDSAGTINEYLAGWNVLNTTRLNETSAERMRREAREADDRYKQGVLKLDEMRCELEEAISLHLRYLERCELDRLKAIKTVVLDFSGTISNVIPSLQSAVDHMMLFQETVQPPSDLRYLLENYRTGGFVPKVVVYENYYNKVDEQTFGVDLEARARADKKRVPAVITALLTYLDHHYPDLEGDEARRGVWLTEVPLAQSHKLRSKINNGKPVDMAVFSESDIPTVASLLKLYLLELPDSLVSSHVYEIIRTIYNTPDNDEARIPILQQTLSQLRLTNIASLDACMNHFTRLIDLTSADEEYVAKLATVLSPCILRPRAQNSLTMEDKHPYRLIRDLFVHKDPIFNELKRMSTMGPGASPAPGLAPSNSLGRNSTRPRAISTDESNRKAHMEERNRLLLEKASGGRGSTARTASPAPAARGAAGGSHRRDRSVGGPETRFPISTPAGMTSPTSPRQAKRQSVGPNLPYKRSSLEVPGQGSPPVSSGSNGSADTVAVDAVSAAAAMAGLGLTDGLETIGNPAVAKVESESKIEKRNSLGRSGARFSGGRRIGQGGSSSGAGVTGITGSSRAGTPPSSGVTLTDKPIMDD